MSKRRRQLAEKVLDGRSIEPFAATVGGKSRKVSPMEDLAIDESDISNEFTRQAALYAWYSALAADANKAAARAKYRWKRARHVKRIELLETGEKYTVAEADALIETDEKVSKLQRKFIDAEALADKTDRLAWAFQQRRDMLQMYGSRIRYEKEIGIREPDEP